MIKNYTLELLHLCSDEQFGQDAVEWAILTGRIKFSYDKEQDLRLIMGEPGRPETGLYSEIVEAYRRMIHKQTERLLDSYQPFLARALTK